MSIVLKRVLSAAFLFGLLVGAGCDEIVVIEDPVVIVNNCPTWDTDPGKQTVVEGQLLRFSVQASDLKDGDGISYSVVTEPKDGTFTFNENSGVLEWTPSFEFSDKDTNSEFEFILRATDDADEEPCTITINVDVVVLNDHDEDGEPDETDTDIDNDGVLNTIEEERGTDPYKVDTDGDGTNDDTDNCPLDDNADQKDDDNDGIGNVCDVCPTDPLNDPDEDGVCNTADNCPDDANPKEDCDGIPATEIEQCDDDDDGVGNVCDPCPNDTINDPDLDGICAFDANGDPLDNCPGDVDDPSTHLNPNQEDMDGDGIGDVCDECKNDATNDIDEDGVCEDVDNCPGLKNVPACDSGDDNGTLVQCNVDGDAFGDECDSNIDGDAFDNDADNCPYVVNDDQADNDEDGLGDVCDDDDDNDGVNDVDGDGDPLDNCQFVANDNQMDIDGDGVGYQCDGSVVIPPDLHGLGQSLEDLQGFARSGTLALVFQKIGDGTCTLDSCPKPGVFVTTTDDDSYAKVYDSSGSDSDSSWLDLTPPGGMITGGAVSQDGSAYVTTAGGAGGREFKRIDSANGVAEDVFPATTPALRSAAVFHDAPDGKTLIEQRVGESGALPGLYVLEGPGGAPSQLRTAASFSLGCVTPGCGTAVGGDAATSMGPFRVPGGPLLVPAVNADDTATLYAYSDADNFHIVQVPDADKSLVEVKNMHVRFVGDDLGGHPWYCWRPDPFGPAKLFRGGSSPVEAEFRDPRGSILDDCENITFTRSDAGVWFMTGLGLGGDPASRKIYSWEPTTQRSGIVLLDREKPELDMKVHLAGPNVYLEVSVSSTPDSGCTGRASSFYRFNAAAPEAPVDTGIQGVFSARVATSSTGWLGVVGGNTSLVNDCGASIVSHRYHPTHTPGGAESGTLFVATSSGSGTTAAWVGDEGMVFGHVRDGNAQQLFAHPRVGNVTKLRDVTETIALSFHGSVTVFSAAGSSGLTNGTIGFITQASGQDVAYTEFAKTGKNSGAHSLFLSGALKPGANNDWFTYVDDNDEVVIAKVSDRTATTTPSFDKVVEGLSKAPDLTMFGPDRNSWFRYEKAGQLGYAFVNPTSQTLTNYVTDAASVDPIRRSLGGRSMLWGVQFKRSSGGASVVCKLPTLQDDVGCWDAFPAADIGVWGPFVSADGDVYGVSRDNPSTVSQTSVKLWRNLDPPQDVSNF